MSTNLVRWSLIGSGVGEAFQTGFWTRGEISSESMLNDCVSAFVLAMRSTASALPKLRSILTSDQSYDKVRAYFYANPTAPATYIAEAPIAHADGVGAVALPSNPLQLAICASLKTARSGASYRGRMFIPATGTDTSSHRASSTVCDDIATAVSEILWEASVSISSSGASARGVPVVYSPTKGTDEEVLQVDVDNVLDTIRARRGKLASTHIGTHSTNWGP
jgi:hypothetical protein